MRWVFRICVFMVILGLGYLALRPYLPKLEKEWEMIVATWENVRDGKAEGINEYPEPVALDEPEPERRRNIIPPEQVVEVGTELTSTEDPFLLEARARAQEDPEAAMEWLQGQGTSSDRLRGMLEVVALWASEDSESALLWLESNAQGLARLETLSSGVELWAGRNPSATASWVDGMANDGSKVTAAKSLASTWVQTQPDEAAAWVASLPEGPLRSEAEAAMAEAWVKIDPHAATIWAFAHAEFNGDNALLHETIKEFSKQSPDEALALARDMYEAGQDGTALFSHIIGRAEEDPAATAEWLANMSPQDPIYSAEYANGLMQVWAESDSIAASQWLSEQPSGDQRDAAVYGFSESIQRFEPEAAAAWANTIDDPDRRMVRLHDSVVQWAQKDAESARNWVETATLEPAVREFLADSLPVEIQVIEVEQP